MEEKERREDALSDNVEKQTFADHESSALRGEFETLKQERDSLYDRLLRKHAEFQNYKKKIERERSESVQSASPDQMYDLLSVLDSFEFALRNAASDDKGDGDTIHGFELIYKQLQDKLGSLGLKALDATGQKFDPSFHQAIATLATDDLEENTVVEEMRKGYLFHGRLLRPSMVSVSVKRSG